MSVYIDGRGEVNVSAGVHGNVYDRYSGNMGCGMVELWNVGVDVNGSASVAVYAGIHVGVGARMGGCRSSWSGAGTVHDKTCRGASLADPSRGLTFIALLRLSSRPKTSADEF